MTDELLQTPMLPNQL